MVLSIHRTPGEQCDNLHFDGSVVVCTRAKVWPYAIWFPTQKSPEKAVQDQYQICVPKSNVILICNFVKKKRFSKNICQTVVFLFFNKMFV